MTSFQELLRQKDTSLADRIERLGKVAEAASGSQKMQYRQEVVSWMSNPNLESLAIGLAARVDAQELAPQIYEVLLQEGLSEGEHSRAMLALGELGYAPAADDIAKFLKGKTKNAATIALMIVAPEKTVDAFAEYQALNPQEGARVAGIGLVNAYKRRNIDAVKACLPSIPEDLLKDAKKYTPLPSDVVKAIDDYTRRT